MQDSKAQCVMTLTVVHLKGKLSPYNLSEMSLPGVEVPTVVDWV